MQTVTEQQKIVFSNSPESLLATNQWPKSLRTMGQDWVLVRVVSFVLALRHLIEKHPKMRVWFIPFSIVDTNA